MKLRLLILALGNFAIGTGALVIAGVLPLIAHTLTVPVTTAGQLVTVYALTYAVAAPLLTALTGRVARRRLLLMALALFIAGNVLAVLAPTFGVLVLARVVSAGGAALFTPIALTVAVTLAPPAERGRALALVFAGLPVATVLGVPLGTFMGAHYGWRATFIVVVLLGVVAAGGVVALIRGVAAPPPLPPRTWLALLRDRRLLPALSLTLLQSTAQFTVFTYIALLLGHTIGLAGTGLSLMLLFFGLAGLIGNSVGGYGADRWSATGTVAVSLVALAIALAALPVAGLSVLGTALALGVWGFAGIAFNPAQQARLLALAPAAPGAVLSLNASALYLGTAAGAVLGGMVAHALTVTMIGPAGALVGVCALVILVVSVRTRATGITAVTASARTSVATTS